MKQTPWVLPALLIGLLFLVVAAQDSPDFTPPTVTWNAPGEGSCWQIDAAHRDLGLVVSAEDPSGIKQGQIWMKAGHHTLASDFRNWPSLWGHTSAPYQLVVAKSMLSVDSLRIIVRAIDRSGRSSLAEVTVRPTRICLVGGTIRR